MVVCLRCALATAPDDSIVSSNVFVYSYRLPYTVEFDKAITNANWYVLALVREYHEDQPFSNTNDEMSGVPILDVGAFVRTLACSGMMTAP